MSNQRWKARWKQNDIAFHQATINPLLRQFWSRLALDRDDTVLVPLCGKSLDMNWLLDQGHRVIGVELSHIAIQSFFAARGLTPNRQRHGRFIRWWHGRMEIWCGDLFDLGAGDLADIGAVYDIAALTALPADSRSQYARLLTTRLPARSQMLLLTTESVDETATAMPLQIDEEVARLYQPHFAIELLHGERCIKIDPQFPDEPASRLAEMVYWMTPQPG